MFGTALTVANLDGTQLRGDNATRDSVVKAANGASSSVDVCLVVAALDWKRRCLDDDVAVAQDGSEM